jgi:uncharacterized protein (TIGR00299 family) protein
VTAPRHIHLDAVGGIAGDMFVAALLDAFPSLQQRVLGDVAAVLPRHCGRAVVSNGTSGGLRTLRFRLDTSHDERAPAARWHRSEAEFRDGRYPALVDRIRGARLHAGTADAAIAILTHLAQVEARMHDVAVDDVHFHELADWDSLMDVVAAGSIAAALEGASWSVSDLPLGGGQVDTAHGRLPVPAPATVELLKGFRWRNDGIMGERVTPTGAAILRHLVASAASSPTAHGRLAAAGTGAGARELDGAPNILRALVFELGVAPLAERVAVISFDVDDMTGEEIGVAADRLRAEAGVLDVSIAASFGKKGRPMTSFRLLVAPAALDAIQQRCFSETSTIGLRWREEERRTLARRITTPAGEDGSTVRVKHVVHPGGEARRKAESDDLRGIDGLQARRARKAQAENAPE